MVSWRRNNREQFSLSHGIIALNRGNITWVTRICPVARGLPLLRVPGRIFPAPSLQSVRNRGAMTIFSGNLSARSMTRWFFSPRRHMPLLVVALLIWPGGATDARIVKGSDDSVENDPRMVFGQIATAWEDGDQQSLADLVHEAGMRVTSGDNPDRSIHYSPSQAFYYFKNLFQSHRTMVLTFDKMQDATAGDRVHGMALWKRRRPDSEQVQEVKLVFVLSRQDDLWRLVEINKIR